jgi:hypothetical protein
VDSSPESLYGQFPSLDKGTVPQLRRQYGKERHIIFEPDHSPVLDLLQQVLDPRGIEVAAGPQ